MCHQERSFEPPVGLSPHAILTLRRSVGNAAVLRLLRQADDTWADPHRHSVGCGHQQDRQAPARRSTVHDVPRAPGRPLDAQRSAGEAAARGYASGNHVVQQRQADGTSGAAAGPAPHA